jgi:hypothetical protein
MGRCGNYALSRQDSTYAQVTHSLDGIRHVHKFPRPYWDWHAYQSSQWVRPVHKFPSPLMGEGQGEGVSLCILVFGFCIRLAP